MRVELTNNLIESAEIFEVKLIISETYHGREYFKFDFGNGKYSKEYSKPNYTYRVLD